MGYIGRAGKGTGRRSLRSYVKSPVAVASQTLSLGPEPSAEAASSSGMNFRPSYFARPSLVSTSRKPSPVGASDKTTGDGSPSAVVKRRNTPPAYCRRPSDVSIQRTPLRSSARQPVSVLGDAGSFLWV